MHKGQEGSCVKTCYEFGNDLMKICFLTQNIMKVDCRFKDIKITYIVIFMAFFCHVFLMFGHGIFPFLFNCGLHSLNMSHNKCCSPHYACILWKKTIENILVEKKERNFILLNVLLVHFSFWSNKYFDMFW